MCEECGDSGIRDALLPCVGCKETARHRYCLDKVVLDPSVVEWWCNDCLPKQNEATLEDVANQRQLRNTHLGPPMISESNMKKKKVTKARGPRRTITVGRRKDHIDARTKHILSGDISKWGHSTNKLLEKRSDSSDARSEHALNSCEMSIGEMSNGNDSEETSEVKNGHLVCAAERIDGSSHLALEHASKIEEANNLQKPMGDLELKRPDLSNFMDGCFSSSKYVEDSVPGGGNGDSFSRTNDVQQSCPVIAAKSHPTSANMEQADGMVVSVEKLQPFKAVKGSNKTVLPSDSPNHSKLMQGSNWKTRNVDALNPFRGCLYSWSKVAKRSRRYELGNPAVEEDNAETTKCSADEVTAGPRMEKHGGSNSSMAKGNSDEGNRRSDGLLLSTKDKMQVQLSGEAHSICDEHSDRVNSPNVISEISDPTSAHGDQVARNLESNAGKTSSPAGRKAICKQVLEEEAVNSDPLSSKYLSPCESTKVNPRKRKQLKSYTPEETENQKSRDVKHKNVGAAGSKSGKLAGLRTDSQSLPRKDSGSHDKVAEHSEMGKDKKKDRSLLKENGLKNQGIYIEKNREALLLRNLDHQSSKNHEQVKKQRSKGGNTVETSAASRSSKNHKQGKQRSKGENGDGNSAVRNIDAGCAENNASQLPLQTAITEDRCGLSRTPLVSEYICAHPVDKPNWSGIMKIEGDYIPLAAHLSTKAGMKVQEQSRSLPPILKVTKLSTSRSCPNPWEGSTPTADSIDFYFFSGDIRPNKELDQLVKHVADSGCVLEAVVGLAKLFLFPSVVLPGEYQMFEEKYYLWGVFQSKKEKRKRLAPAEQGCTAHAVEKKHVQKQHLSYQAHKVPCRDTMDQEMPLVNGVMHSKNQPLLVET